MLTRERLAGSLLVVLVAMAAVTQARYLPTRSQDDKLLRLRQLLRDLLENDVEPVEHPIGGGSGYDPRLYKREAIPSQALYDRPDHLHH